MLAILLRAIGQLGDPAILRVLLRSLLVTLLLFALLATSFVWSLDGVDPCGWLGHTACPLGISASSVGAVVLTALAAWLLFPAVAIGVVSAYAGDVVAAVERRHYPAALASARRLGSVRSTWLGLRSSLRLLAYNLAALPLYVALLASGIGTVIAVIVVNGVALGRDLGEMVAARHLGRAGARRWLHGTRGPRAVLGMAVTALFLVPLVNLLVPVIAAAMATHLFHETAARPAA